MGSKWNKQINSLSDAQIRLARKFQEYSITSYSKAIKALANRDNRQIETWKQQLTLKVQYANLPKLTSSDLWDGDPNNTTVPAIE